MNSKPSPVWEMIYSQGKQLNRWPYGDLVSRVMRMYSIHFKERIKRGEKIKVLEVGSGAGNNLWFLSEVGFDVYGCDGSDTAVKVSQEYLKNRGYSPQIDRVNLTALPYDSNVFDLIVDRQAIYANKMSDIRTIFSEVERCLKPGGFFLGYLFSEKDDSPKKYGAKEIEPRTYIDFKEGPFKDTGFAHFFSKEELANDVLKNFDIESLVHHQFQQEVPNLFLELAEWIVVARKKGSF